MRTRNAATGALCGFLFGENYFFDMSVLRFVCATAPPAPSACHCELAKRCGAPDHLVMIGDSICESEMKTILGILVALAPLAAFAAHAAPAAPKPAPELQKAIDAFVGTWTIAEEYPPSGTGKGTETWRAGPGNMSLVYEYASETPHGAVSAMAILWWDARAKTFRELWCAGASKVGCTLSPAIIRWDHDDLVFSEFFERGGKRVYSHEVWSDIKPGSHTTTISEGERMDALKPWLVSHATRSAN